MIQRLIIFLIRVRLGLKVNECFQFTNQKTTALYFFTRTGITKYWRGNFTHSGISLNWLLDPNCKETLIHRGDININLYAWTELK